MGKLKKTLAVHAMGPLRGDAHDPLCGQVTGFGSKGCDNAIMAWIPRSVTCKRCRTALRKSAESSWSCRSKPYGQLEWLRGGYSVQSVHTGLGMAWAVRTGCGGFILKYAKGRFRRIEFKQLQAAKRLVDKWVKEENHG